MDFDLCVAHIEYLDEKGLVRGLTKNTLREYEAQLVDGKLILCEVSHFQVITP